MPDNPTPSPEALLRAANERPTAARCAVLAVLLDAERALTHLEIAERLSTGQRVNRVTLYRILDWLVERRLAHKIAGEDRVWRFNAFPEGERDTHRHAHFRCTRCGNVTCLADMSTTFALALPPGFRAQAVELNISGVCGGCAGG